MRIGSASSTITTAITQRAGNELPSAKIQESSQPQDSSLIRELAASVDPKNMSWQESLDMANALMKAGEGELSIAFLPPPLLRLNDDGSVTDVRERV